MNSSRTILIIDDDPIVREPYRALLEAEGLVVAEANNGAEAVLWLHNKAADLIILDLKMPVMDGRSFLEYRLRERRIQSVPVLVLSSWFENGGLREILTSLGAYHLLQKPVRGDELVSTVRELLTRSSRSDAPPPGEAQEASLRQDPRVAFAVPIRVRSGYSTETSGTLCDLSAGGLGMYLPHRVPSTGTITVTLDIQGRSVTLKGFVHWTAESHTPMGFRHGIRFSEKQEDSFPLYTYSFFREHSGATS